MPSPEWVEGHYKEQCKRKEVRKEVERRDAEMDA
jgi:hypothetical protein